MRRRVTHRLGQRPDRRPSQPHQHPGQVIQRTRLGFPDRFEEERLPKPGLQRPPRYSNLSCRAATSPVRSKASTAPACLRVSVGPGVTLCDIGPCFNHVPIRLCPSFSRHPFRRLLRHLLPMFSAG